MTAAKTKPPRWTEYVSLDDVLRAPRNPKNHNAEVIAASMARFGVVEHPAMDERTGRLVAGHGRLEDWERRRDAGEDPPDGIMVNEAGAWMVPVTRGWSSRSDADAEAYLIVSNQSTILGGWEERELADILHDLKDEGLLDLTGFDEDGLDNLDRKNIDADAPEDFPSFDSETISTEHQCPACGYQWSGSSAPRGEDETAVEQPEPNPDDA
jgi:hypothetical protein